MYCDATITLHKRNTNIKELHILLILLVTPTISWILPIVRFCGFLTDGTYTVVISGNFHR